MKFPAATAANQPDTMPRIFRTRRDWLKSSALLGTCAALPVARVEVYYSIDPDPRARFWRSAEVVRGAGEFSAKLPLHSHDFPLFAFANVYHTLPKPESLAQLPGNAPEIILTPIDLSAYPYHSNIVLVYKRMERTLQQPRYYYHPKGIEIYDGRRLPLVVPNPVLPGGLVVLEFVTERTLVPDPKNAKRMMTGPRSTNVVSHYISPPHKK
jgi:hypothetical protein